MSEQPEALRLADEMVNYWNERGPDAEAVAAELRRLHAENEEQCRLNGMGSEREARLMAENEALRAALHSISLAGSDSGSTREGMALYARAALAAKERT